MASDPDVHRDLIVITPPIPGRDVANLQRAIRNRFGRDGGSHPRLCSQPQRRCGVPGRACGKRGRRISVAATGG